MPPNPYAAIGAVLIALLLTVIVIQYLRMRRAVSARLAAGSQIVTTLRGPLEAAIRQGGSPTLLVSHGNGGGYDQGLAIAELAGGSECRIVAVSRAGYLRTPCDQPTRPEVQADDYAALLDALDIPQAVVMGVSAGGPAALQFALRHPDRCAGLILISALTLPVQVPGSARTLFTLMARLDPLSWLAYPLIKNRLITSNGPLPAPVKADSARMQALNRLMRMPLGSADRRLAGIINDFEQSIPHKNYPLEKITRPALVIHGLADPLIPPAHAEAAASAIPDAELILIDGAGHLCFVTHHELVEPAVRRFLKSVETAWRLHAADYA